MEKTSSFFKSIRSMKTKHGGKDMQKLTVELGLKCPLGDYLVHQQCHSPIVKIWIETSTKMYT